MTPETYARLRSIYLNLTFYARHGVTRYNGESFGPADPSTIKQTQQQLAALRSQRAKL